MNKLSYFAKSQIFLWASFSVAVLDIFVSFSLLSTLWGVLFAIGGYYWGRNSEAHKNLRKNKLYSPKADVVG